MNGQNVPGEHDQVAVEGLIRRLGDTSSGDNPYTTLAARARPQAPLGCFSIAPNCRISVALILAALDLLGAVAAIWALPSDASSTWELIILAILVVSAAQLSGFYATDSSADLQRSTRGVLAIGVVLLPTALGLAWFAASRTAWNVVLALACVLGMAALGRLVCSLAAARFAERMVERVLIVGRCHAGDWLVRSGWVLEPKAKIVGQVTVGDGEPCAPLVGHVAAGGDVLSDIIAAIHDPTCDINRIVILKLGLDDGQFANIVRGLEAVSFPVDVLTDQSGSDRSVGWPMGARWIVRGAPIQPGAMFVKRGMDVLASVAALILLAPALVLIGAAIRLETPGPALFWQVRLGRDNRPFTMLKFRTMRADAHSTDGSVQAVRRDERVTRIGAMLRRTSLDEVPQLLNVLNGTMSLVGPRPHPTGLNRRFVPLIQGYSARHRVAPGITGWAQVNGLRGETQTLEQMQRRVELDLEYVGNHSIAFDIWILLRTVIAVVIPRNAY